MDYFTNSDNINCPVTLSLLAEDGESELRGIAAYVLQMDALGNI